MSATAATAIHPEAAYPVRVDADLDPEVSRGLWLVKWILAIPHYVVLAFLWIAFVVTTVVAFFSILFTARYPRQIFDFNVGVMRWSWRVAYYAYGVLGTDRYPPFALAEVPDYPAHLDVDYPEHLSRGLVLIKWWLLAIPHLLVVGLFLGAATYGVRGVDDAPLLSISLIGILVLVAGFALLFTGRYPAPVFDLILGLNRWVLRVAGYVALMTDRYPPFRLDQGGHEARAAQHGPTALPTPLATGDPPATATALSTPYSAAPPPSGPGRSDWTASRVVSLVIGCLMVLTSLGLVGCGAVLVNADQFGRDDDGFLMGPQQRLTTDGFAITSEDVQIHTDWPLTRVPESLIGDVRVSVDPAGAANLFVGIAPTAAVQDYLSDVRHDTLLEIRDGDPVYRSNSGGTPETLPAEQTFWVAQSSGVTAELTWTLRDGDWTVVVMNSDASTAVAADVAAGAEVPVLSTAIATLFILAGLGLLVGALLIALPIRSVNRRSTA